MAIYERVINQEGFPGLDPQVFGAAIAELARGAVTKQQVVDTFFLTTDDEVELDAIIAVYQGLGTDLEKAAYVLKVRDVFLLSDAMLYPKAKAKNELGI